MSGYIDHAAVAAYIGAHPTLGRDLAIELGYEDVGDKLVGRCPWHDDRQASSVVFDPSSSTTGRWLAWDQPCGSRRDVVDLLAKTLRLPDTRGPHYRACLLEGCRRLGVDPHTVSADSVPPAPTPRPPRELDAGQRREVRELGAALLPLTSAAPEAEAARAWMHAAGLRPEALEALEAQRRGPYRLAGILPASLALPAWARLGEQTWIESGHPLVVSRWTCAGEPGWPKARAIEAEPWLKSVGPKGSTSRGLVGANRLYWQLLCAGSEKFMATWRQALASGWTRDEHPTLALCEGEKDGLALAGVVPDDVLVGWVDSGAWTPEHAARIPDGTRVLILTDSDGAGMRYQTEIAETLSARCGVKVLHAAEAYRQDGGEREKLPDVADLVRDGATWVGILGRVVDWTRPAEAAPVVEAVEDATDIDAICTAASAAVAPCLPPEQPSSPSQPAVPWWATSGPQRLAGLAKAAAELYAVPDTVPAPTPAPAGAAAAPVVELDRDDPRRAVCGRLGEVPIVRRGDRGVMVYITSRCCPPPPGSSGKKLSLINAASGDVLARCWVCGRSVNARDLAPVVPAGAAPKAQAAPSAPPVLDPTPAAPKVKPAPKPGAPAAPVAPRAPSPIEAVIAAALAGGPMLREAVVARIREVGLKATRAQLRDARDAAGIKSYTLADQQWWALPGGAEPVDPAMPPLEGDGCWVN